MNYFEKRQPKELNNDIRLDDNEKVVVTGDVNKNLDITLRGSTCLLVIDGSVISDQLKATLRGEAKLVINGDLLHCENSSFSLRDNSKLYSKGSITRLKMRDNCEAYIDGSVTEGSISSGKVYLSGRTITRLNNVEQVKSEFIHDEMRKYVSY